MPLPAAVTTLRFEFDQAAALMAMNRWSGEPLPLEVFVHGALCVAYSGQCLTSESLGGRSANRGRCYGSADRDRGLR